MAVTGRQRKKHGSKRLLRAVECLPHCNWQMQSPLRRWNLPPNRRLQATRRNRRAPEPGRWASTGTIAPMLPTYAELADLRVRSAPDGFLQPECFGYNFHDWISPYTKGACKPCGIAVVLQDWASESELVGPCDTRIALLGRDPDRITNRRLEALLVAVLGTSLSDVYATNVFPFVKPGTMSASIPQELVNRTAQTFTVPELAIANPTLVLALGKVAQRALHKAQVRCIDLPHPAARRLDLAGHERIWRSALASKQNDASPFHRADSRRNARQSK